MGNCVAFVSLQNLQAIRYAPDSARHTLLADYVAIIVGSNCAAIDQMVAEPLVIPFAMVMASSTTPFRTRRSMVRHRTSCMQGQETTSWSS
jgi:hypothetical protein